MKVDFVPPNYRCKVKDRDKLRGRTFYVLCYSENEAELGNKLDKLGFRIIETQLYDFKTTWGGIERREVENAGQNIKSALAAGQKPSYEFPPFWLEWKAHLIDLFHGKCAYCEADFEHVDFGDVEHYRPKGGVSDDPSHPGYWWLAYEPSNYLPACRKCNEYAKKYQFPINGTRATKPEDDIENEQPLLVNPYKEDHAKHIDFIPSDVAQNPAMAIGIDACGINTINIVLLNRAKLRNYRQQEMEDALNAFLRIMNSGNRERLNEFVEEVLRGEKEFSTAIRAEINKFLIKMGFSPLFL